MFSVRKNAINANKYETRRKKCNDALYAAKKKQHYNNPIYVQHIWHNDFLSKYSFIY